MVEWVLMTMMMIGGVDGWAMMQQGLPEEEPKCAASILPAGTHHFLSSLVLAPTTGFFTTGPTNFV